MTFIQRLIGKMQESSDEQVIPTDKKRVIGKIIKVSPKGWGFIVSKEIQFTRIFFHWSGLNQDTLHFTELEKGMTVEFELLENPEKGLRAIRIKVLEDYETDETENDD